LIPIAVDEQEFFAALHRAGSVRATDEARSGALAPASEVPGLRVCCYMILCVGSKLQGQHRSAKRYYDMARSCIAPAYLHPNQHLVSALLLMTILTRSVCPDDNQAILHAALALEMANLVPDLSPEVRGHKTWCAYLTEHY
jgi:hypothetical protein